MAGDKVTKEKLLESAKREFLEKGYMKASLRTICKNAGVTTGALYFFFQGKGDLLKELVEEPLRGLMGLIRQHFTEEMERRITVVSLDMDRQDIDAAKEIVRFLYRHYDVFLLLLTKSQGSEYEDMASRFADYGEEHYRKLTADAARDCRVPAPDGYMVHWMSHMQINAFVHLLLHEPDVEKALVYIEQVVVFLVSGWNGFFQRGRTVKDPADAGRSE
ncbi:MAG: TetR/AcrR family transcriptional regulator [Lachnospiraceae bacterium]